MKYGIRFTYTNGMTNKTEYNTEKDRDEAFETLETFDWSGSVVFVNAIVNLRNVIRCDKFEE